MSYASRLWGYRKSLLSPSPASDKKNNTSSYERQLADASFYRQDYVNVSFTCQTANRLFVIADTLISLLAETSRCIGELSTVNYFHHCFNTIHYFAVYFGFRIEILIY